MNDFYCESDCCSGNMEATRNNNDCDEEKARQHKAEVVEAPEVAPAPPAASNNGRRFLWRSTRICLIIFFILVVLAGIITTAVYFSSIYSCQWPKKVSVGSVVQFKEGTANKKRPISGAWLKVRGTGRTLRVVADWGREDVYEGGGGASCNERGEYVGSGGWNPGCYSSYEQEDEEPCGVNWLSKDGVWYYIRVTGYARGRDTVITLTVTDETETLNETARLVYLKSIPEV